MEIVGGFMVMISILGFFLALIWLSMPFVVFTIKGKLDRTLDVLAGLEKRIAAMEAQLAALQKTRVPEQCVEGQPNPSTDVDDSSSPSLPLPE